MTTDNPFDIGPTPSNRGSTNKEVFFKLLCATNGLTRSSLRAILVSRMVRGDYHNCETMGRK